MSTFPLEKVRSILDYWVELTLPIESREKRMREKADKAAQEVFEKISTAEVEVIDSEKNQGDSEALQRFLDLIG